MPLSQALMRVGILVSASALFAAPTGALAGEQHLEF
jgi:hypothetical protein